MNPHSESCVGILYNTYMKENEIIIFTDGSSRRNPGVGGWGAIVIHGDTVHELGDHVPHTTNNRMELTAVIQALQCVSKLPTSNSKLSTVVNTDSSYVLKGATLWVDGWKKNNWKTKSRDDVLNKDLWEELLPYLHEKISWNLLKGHSGNPGNERCDVIATGYADNTPPTLYSGLHREYSVDVFQVVQVVSKKNIKRKSNSKSKPYSYVSSVGGVIQKHASWTECEARVKGKKGALFKKAFSVQDEQNITTLWKGLPHS